MAKRGRLKWGRWLLRLMLVLLALWAGGLLRFAAELPRERNEAKTPPTGIAVLTGEADRLRTALALLRQSPGQRLLISGVNEALSEQDLRQALGLANPATGQDLFACCIDVGRDALHTPGNALEVKAWAQAKGYARIRLVTAAYHMPRSRLELKRVAPKLEIEEHPVFPRNVKLESWWNWPGTTQVVMIEYNKYLLSLVRWRFSGAAG